MHCYLPIHYFQRNAREFPNRVAVRSEGLEYTYSELDRISDAIAQRIQESAPSPMFRVGLRLSKSANYIACILGVWKARGTYVPLEPKLPMERTAYIIEDCHLHMLIGEEDFSHPGVQTLLLSGVLRASGEHGTPFEVRGKGTDLAYIIYTSGTTGNPKGVMISNDSLTAFINWCARCFGAVGGLTDILNVANFSFDQSVLDIAFFLARAMTLYVLDDPGNIVKIPFLIAKYRIGFVSTVPHVFAILTNSSRLVARFDLSSLKVIILGGAVFPAKLVQPIKEMFPGTEIYNLYGPTEATVYCFLHRVDDCPVDPTQPLPIGRPFDNTDALILDTDGQTLGPNELGEIALSGPQVMRGYWNMSERNEQVLVPDPRDAYCYNRIYLTGDLGFVDDGGIYNFRGRRDNMVKVSGYRVDLGDISHKFDEHPEVVEAVAVNIPDDLLENRIKVVVKIVAGAKIASNDLMEYLRKRLPGYMVPQEIIFCDDIPKNFSGKIDMKRIRELCTVEGSCNV